MQQIQIIIFMEVSIINYVDSKLTPKLCEQWVQAVINVVVISRPVLGSCVAMEV